MKKTKTLTALGLICALGAGGIVAGPPTPAAAQNAAYLSCGELWRARNAIYARNGYCFKTPDAIAVFGEGCFPPYKRLSGWEKNRVNQLQMWERRKGC